MRLVGVATGRQLAPSIEAVVGLAGFDSRVRSAGATTVFRWTDLPPAAGEAAVVVSGFVPERVALRPEGLVFEGVPNPTAVRLVSADPGIAVGPAVPEAVVETRYTPDGVPYIEAYLPATGPESEIPASIVDASGRRLGTVMVPIQLLA